MVILSIERFVQLLNAAVHLFCPLGNFGPALFERIQVILRFAQGSVELREPSADLLRAVLEGVDGIFALLQGFAG